MKQVPSFIFAIILFGTLTQCKKEESGPPLVTTELPTSIANTTAVLNGSVNPNNLQTNVSFEYGLTTSYGQTKSPTTSNINGTTITNVTIDIGTLTSGITYHYRVRAENEKGIVYGEDKSFTTTISDYDGNIYTTITIGNQVWMKENLKSTTFSDGTPISFVNTTNDWAALTYTSIAYCWPAGDIANKDLYGALYTWTAVMNGASSSDNKPSGVQGVCPVGWHLPSDSEWKELEDYLGGGATAGGKLKETGTIHWLTPNTGATNETNFTAMPGGWRGDNGSFMKFGTDGYWWSSTGAASYDQSIRRLISYISASSYWGSVGKDFGLSVRCIRDQN